MNKPLIVIRGAGDFSSAIAHRLYRVGYKVLMLEVGRPTAIRREVCFSEAVYSGSKSVENVECYCASGYKEAQALLKKGKLTVMVDAEGRYVPRFEPHIVVDALKHRIERKKISSALYTIGVGGGLCAGPDADCVIETSRGHDLGRIIYSGRAKKPKSILNVVADGMGRYVVCNMTGVFTGKRIISSLVKRGDKLATITDDRGAETTIYAPLDGVLRGIMHDGITVMPGMRLAEVDPRAEATNCFKISDRARTVSGSVLEAIMVFERQYFS